MKRNIKVKGRNGVIRSVNDDYVLLDGEARVIELPFMDSHAWDRRMVHDGRGQPAGQRPGFLYSNSNEQTELALADAYTQYADAIQNRWRGKQQQQQRSAPQTFDSVEAARTAAYAEYNRTIQQRWRK